MPEKFCAVGPIDKLAPGARITLKPALANIDLELKMKSQSNIIEKLKKRKCRVKEIDKKITASS
ncbi:hypothetical protein NQ315_014964 [Exocentrus adspersus]|uniref:Uncharacterized protein n=1 Tax=Exocentrus adspersus TaxID=1586481 RepID=A0AAV8V7X4_9CUCU|nr:hypothetical protein NQ315_014964 [Exocentrus adspersus]